MSVATNAALALVPIVVRWSASLANRPSSDGKTFRPVNPIRFVYDVGLIVSGWGVCFYLKLLVYPSEPFRSGDWVGLIGMASFFMMAIASWPATIIAVENGLHWKRLFFRKFVPWTDLEDAVVSMDGRAVLYLRGGKEVELNEYCVGRSELVQMVKKHVRTQQRSVATT
jgi:hypothetical protein